MIEFKILTEITEIQTIATGRGVAIRRHLERLYGKGKWRKLEGVPTVELSSGTIQEAEIHWYEAQGIGRRDFKIKRFL